MKIGLVQCNPVTGDIAGNGEMLFQGVKKAAAQGAELCIAPELALCGPNAGDLLLRRAFIACCRNELQALAARLAIKNFPPLLLGAPMANPVPQGKSLQSCAVLLYEGNVSVIGRKILLPCLGPLNDTRYFEPGLACGVLQYKGWRIAVTIGEDAWNNSCFWEEDREFSIDPLAEFMDAGGADCIVNLTSLPYVQGMPALHQRVLGWLAVNYRVPVLAVNAVGGNDGVIYYGESCAYANDGALIAHAPAFEEVVLIVDIVDGAAITSVADVPLEEELWKAVVLGTKDFSRKCGFKKAVLGLSGGVDSALVASIAAEAFGAENVTGILMPSPYSSQSSVNDSLNLAKKLGIRTQIISIEDILKSYSTKFEHIFDHGLQGLTEENVQARIRGTILMAYANEYNCMVLNTCNKSEAAVGYSTLYGDQIGALGIIADLYKHQVYSLCYWLNKKYGTIIPVSTLEKTPSAELRPEQRDSDTLPNYDVLDGILMEHLEYSKSFQEIVDAGYNSNTVRMILSMVQQAEFKRKQAPTILQLSSTSFAMFWNMPIANKYKV